MSNINEGEVFGRENCPVSCKPCSHFGYAQDHAGFTSTSCHLTGAVDVHQLFPAACPHNQPTMTLYYHEQPCIMTLVRLGNGEFALVDDDPYDTTTQYFSAREVLERTQTYVSGNNIKLLKLFLGVEL